MRCLYVDFVVCVVTDIIYLFLIIALFALITSDHVQTFATFLKTDNSSVLF